MKALYTKGVSFIEIVIVIAVIGILVAIVVPSLTLFRNEQALRNTTADIVSLLNEARTNTISSINSSQYGVYFESGRAVLFVGSTFTEPNATNKEVEFSNAVTIPSSGGISLSGSGSSIVFSRISGDTSNYGTIIVQLVSDTSRSKTITIGKTGRVSTN